MNFTDQEYKKKVRNKLHGEINKNEGCDIRANAHVGEESIHLKDNDKNIIPVINKCNNKSEDSPEMYE